MDLLPGTVIKAKVICYNRSFGVLLDLGMDHIEGFVPIQDLFARGNNTANLYPDTQVDGWVRIPVKSATDSD
jgi:hypothetical protein